MKPARAGPKHVGSLACLETLLPGVPSGPCGSPVTRPFAEVADERIAAACRALGFADDKTAPFRQEFRDLVADWGHKIIGSRPWYESFASNDGTPAEMSFSWSSSGVEVRVGAECAADDGSAFERQVGAVRLTRRLAQRPGVRIDRYLAVEDLFALADPRGQFSIGHVVVWRPRQGSTFKLYLDPAASETLGLLSPGFPRQ